MNAYLIDDGRHLPQVVIDEDASTAAGTARYRATCSCGQMPHHPASTRDQALHAHAAHASTRLGPSRGLGVRVTILVTAMLTTWGACYATGQIITHTQALTSTAAATVLGCSHMAGLGLAFGLMVAARRYIVPTR
ncbi:hypothetical protein OOK13_45130 [Streptomyces sp. NBC_00378]|uniref:hypothetical protein n=1 Tax=Streptomyces sp. NBC_00378 TaxID=2975732 RepID=UPI00225861CE|nr:hypothetical protein [Streptomyces sp. NBC_00378]MCX5115483.1 hypothetical protein [Streptomyces sp. NBC_00378]